MCPKYLLYLAHFHAAKHINKYSQTLSVLKQKETVCVNYASGAD